MSKKFKGFTPEQQYILLKKMEYKGPPQQDEMDKFLAASPDAAARMGRFAQIASQRVIGKPLSNTVKMAEGGSVSPTSTGTSAVQEGLDLDTRIQNDAQTVYNNQMSTVQTHQSVLSSLQNELTQHEEGSPEYQDIQNRINQRTTALSEAQQAAALAQNSLQQDTRSTERELLSNALSNPSEVLQKAQVTGVQNTGAGMIDPNTGQVTSNPNVNASTYTASTATSATPTDAAKYQATTAAGAVGNAVSQVEAAQGTLSERITAAQGDPEQMAQLLLEVAQMEAAQVNAVNPRQLEPGEAVDGSAVDMAAVSAALEVEAAQADPSAKATVQGQLEGLMQSFEGGATPAWAAGAMRQANAAMAARGLGASSMAGQAVIQATMEAAVPIAAADAQTYAQFEMQNLTNRQQTVMFAAQQRAEFLGQKFDQDFQAKVLNAAKISEIANMNFTAEQQVALENARLAQSANLENMNARNAKVLADAAAMSQMELTNLNNRQQAQVQNAQNFLQMDLANLSNQQQTNIFQAQAMVSAMLSDQAADNAAKQFNAASQNQTNQFFADLQTTVSRFNAEQRNAASQFNSSERNAISTFNATMQAERDRFNASNSLVIAQANAQWRQNISMAEFEAQNQANMQYAQDLNGLTTDQLDQLWQRERDIMAYAFQGSENAADRDLSLLLGDRDIALQQQALDAEERAGWGALAAEAIFGNNGLLSFF